MTPKLLFFGMVFICPSGCAAYQLEPPNITHPANPQAMAAPAHPLSKTLAYSRADSSGVSPVANPEGGHEGHHIAAESISQKTVIGEGKVIAILPSANQIVVEHGEIKGFMDAMTMGYRAEPSSLLERLNSGDRIRFTIDVPNKAIIKIEKVK
jgi:Cu/Ag efflux protein CusF